MLERLLNRTVKIIRKDTTVSGISASGDIKSSTDITVATGVKIRITKNDVYQEEQMRPQQSTHMATDWLAFTLPSVDIKVHDILEDEVSGIRYNVAWTDDIPGGAGDSHKEVYINTSREE